MLNVCLLTLIWMADPSAVNFDASNVVVPMSTCARPAVRVAEAQSSCATPSSLLMVESTFVRWEQQSRLLPVISRSRCEEFRRRHEGVNEHALTAAERLSGPVTARSLNESYCWKIQSLIGDWICLEGTPRDEMELLFYRSIRVTFRMGDALPEQVVVVGRDPQRQVIWNLSPLANRDTIELVQFESGVPPAPTDTRRRFVGQQAAFLKN